MPRKYRFRCRNRKCGFQTNDEFEAAAHFWRNGDKHKLTNFDPWTMPHVDKGDKLK